MTDRPRDLGETALLERLQWRTFRCVKVAFSVPGA
jgi:hypothetical protein